jgi:YD repeat-containing protein
VTQVVDGEGRAVDYGYDASGNQILQRDAAGNSVTRTFDLGNQLLTETAYLVPDPDGAGAGQPATPLTSRFVYDAGGKNLLRFVLSPEGRVTQYTYDGYGQRTAAIQYGAAVYDTSALGTTVPTEAQMTTWVTAQDKTRSMRTDYFYDARGALQKTHAYTSVDSAGLGVADANRSITQYVYDQAGLLLKTISAAQRLDQLHLRRPGPPAERDRRAAAADDHGLRRQQRQDQGHARQRARQHLRLRPGRPARLGAAGQCHGTAPGRDQVLLRR